MGKWTITITSIVIAATAGWLPKALSTVTDRNDGRVKKSSAAQ